jgi:nickel-type superoxide dismutase maturation protease
MPGPVLRRLVRSWMARVAVEGGSMRPTLHPGDWLLVDPHAYQASLPRAGELVLVPDPRDPERLLVKRVADVDPQGWLLVSGDAPEASTDSRVFGPVDPAMLEGQPWFCYWPPGRIGRIR